MNVTLFKKDNSGKIRQWDIYTENDNYFVRDGIVGGKMKDFTSTTSTPKNIGKSNQTTGEQQALVDAQNIVKKKLKDQYFHTYEEALNNEKNFQPNLAESIKDYPNKYQPKDIVGYQPKVDGIRSNFEEDNVGRSREREVFATTHTIAKEIAELRIFLLDCYKSFNNADMSALPEEFIKNMIFDGELYNHTFHDDFNTLTSLINRKKVTEKDQLEIDELLEYHIYDFYSPDFPNLTFEQRYQILGSIENLIDSAQFSRLKFIPTTVATMEELERIHAENIENGYEGTMIRDLNSAYQVDKRSTNLLKVKDFIDGEFKIIDVLPGVKGKAQFMASKVVVEVSPGVYSEAGLKLDHAKRKHMLEHKEEFIGQMATITYFNITKDGKLRKGVYKGLRTIK